MRVDDRREEPWEAFLDLRATRCVEHLHTFAFTADEPRRAQDCEVLRESGLGNLTVAYRQKGRAVLLAALDNVDEDGGAHGVRERMENCLDLNLFNGGMDERPHVPNSSAEVQKFVNSELLNLSYDRPYLMS